MLTPEDIQQIENVTRKQTDELAKLIVHGFDNTASKQAVIDIKQEVTELRTSVDGLAKTFYVAKLNHVEDWIKQAAIKLGLEYKT